MNDVTDRLDRVLAADYVAGLVDLPLEEVRARRAECQEIEGGLSYARRIVQGRLDIALAEVHRRATGEPPSSTSEIVDRLKGGEMLGEHARPPGMGRLPTNISPGQGGEEFLAEADDVAAHESLANLADLDDAEVQRLSDELGDIERRLSERRRAVFDRIDTFQAEIVRRYKSGAASTDSLLAN